MRASSSRLSSLSVSLLPARPSRAHILPCPLTELTGRNGVPLLDVRRARTCTHIAPTDPHELHISSLHMNAARRPDPPAAIYYRVRCLVQFTYDYADAPGSAPTYASTARQDEAGRISNERRKEKRVGSLSCGRACQIVPRSRYVPGKRVLLARDFFKAPLLIIKMFI